MIRRACMKDLAQLNAWMKEFDSTEILATELTNEPFSNIVVYEENDQIVGFLSFRLLYERAELDYIYVDSVYRKHGYAKKLMDYLVHSCIKAKCENITLEVDCNNEGAIQLYRKLGFQIVALRKQYYHGTDGYLMMKELMDK